MRVEAGEIAFDDRVQGRVSQDLKRDVGDFIVLRADHVFAYQLAVVADDAAQGITDIVRGADLLDSTPRQIWLQQRLGLPTPRHAHVPAAVNSEGQKLSKQTRALPVDTAAPVQALTEALRFLGQALPAPGEAGTVPELLEYARVHWQIGRVPRVTRQQTTR
jgi:glutamyl-Q tRNA(Asp) synthetase